MLRADGLVKVLDFGLAKLTQKHEGDSSDSQTPTRALVKTNPGVVMGTVAYMSPEQARGLAVDVRTDVFSLGIIVYEMLAGRLPFAGATASDMMAAILTSEPAALDETAPPELQRIVKKSLQKNVDERYQTAKDLLIDLKALKQGQDFSAELNRSGIPTKADQTVPTQDRGARTHLERGVHRQQGQTAQGHFHVCAGDTTARSARPWLHVLQPPLNNSNTYCVPRRPAVRKWERRCKS
jgi:serine/threonine protein kinase